MRRSFWTGCLLLLSLAAACAADIRPPDRERGGRRPGPTSGLTVTMQVIPGEPGQPARLEIPEGVLDGLRPGPAQPASGPGAIPGTLGTVVSGLALSMSLMLGGLWLVRRKRSLAAAGAAGLLIAAAAGLLATRAFANAAPFPLPRESKPLPGQVSVRTSLYLVDGGDSVKLYLPKDRLTSLLSPKKSGPAGGALAGSQPQQSARPQANPPVTRK